MYVEGRGYTRRDGLAVAAGLEHLHFRHHQFSYEANDHRVVLVTDALDTPMDGVAQGIGVGGGYALGYRAGGAA